MVIVINYVIGGSSWVDLVWLAASTVRLQVSNYSQLSDYTLWLYRLKLSSQNNETRFHTCQGRNADERYWKETVPKSVHSENHTLLRSTWKSKKDCSSVVGLETFPAIFSNVNFAAGTKPRQKKKQRMRNEKNQTHSRIFDSRNTHKKKCRRKEKEKKLRTQTHSPSWLSQ